MRVESPELIDLMYATQNRSMCNDIGDAGENLIAEIFEIYNIPYHMTAHDCPVDFIVPTLTRDLGIEVKTSLTPYDRVVLSWNKKDRDIKKWYCSSNELKPVTILVKKLPGYDVGIDFNILWKWGIKKFHIDKMWDFETFIERFKAPVFQLKGTGGSTIQTARCAHCGRFSRSYTTRKRLSLRVGPDWRNRTFEKHIYRCTQHMALESLWRETDE